MTGRSVLITGAGGGLGAAVTGTMRAGGWRIVAAGRTGLSTRLAPVVTDLAGDGEVEVVEADLGEPAGAAAAVARAAAAPAAPLRAVVNLVGGFAAGGRVHETPVTAFEAMLALNLRPTYLVTAAALPHLAGAGGGAVVCVSSRAALRPFPGAAGYVTAKAAVLAFAEAVAVEYGRDRIRCNTVVPGVIDTAANRAAMPDADRSGWVAPEEIARVIAFLAGADSAPTTGAVVPVHGVA